jgi:transcriptional regulator with XRE-family HTH domain
MGSSRQQPKKLAAKLHHIRKTLGLTQQQMVDRLKAEQERLRVYPGNISRFEQGVREPTLLVLLAYAKVAQITIDRLVDDELEL